MALVVQKFGGTSVADLERMRNVAQRALETQRAGNEAEFVHGAEAAIGRREVVIVSDAALWCGYSRPLAGRNTMALRTAAA